MVIAIYLPSTSLKGVSSLKLHRDLKITQKSAYFPARRLREAWSNNPGGMAGPVEVDETCIGGRRGNMPGRKRQKLMQTVGGGPTGKAAVAGPRDRPGDRVSASVVPDTKRSTLHGFVEGRTRPGAKVFNDDRVSHVGMKDREHEAVRHSVGEYVRAQAHTNGAESLRATLERGYHGTFHRISPKPLHRYVDEFATRHNMRERDTGAMMGETVARMVGKRPMYRDPIADRPRLSLPQASQAGQPPRPRRPTGSGRDPTIAPVERHCTESLRGSGTRSDEPSRSGSPEGVSPAKRAEIRRSGARNTHQVGHLHGSPEHLQSTATDRNHHGPTDYWRFLGEIPGIRCP